MQLFENPDSNQANQYESKLLLPTLYFDNNGFVDPCMAVSFEYCRVAGLVSMLENMGNSDPGLIFPTIGALESLQKFLEELDSDYYFFEDKNNIDRLLNACLGACYALGSGDNITESQFHFISLLINEILEKTEEMIQKLFEKGKRIWTSSPIVSKRYS